MKLKTWTWSLISLLCFAGAWWFWQLGNERRAQPRPPAPWATNAPTAADRIPESSAVTPPAAGGLVSSLSHDAARSASPSVQVPQGEPAWRLRNTSAALDELVKTEQAILLRNALLDTRRPATLAVPESLRAPEDPGSYIVQARGAITDTFRARLRAAGAEVISYIPNNAYLVRANGEAARFLAGLPETQAVLPWEPYYKLAPALLERVREPDPSWGRTRLSLLLFPGQRETVAAQLPDLGATVFGEDRNTFGPVLQVALPWSAVAAVARMSGVQGIEPHAIRQPANDLGRERLNVSEDTVVPDNYLGLSGAGVRVNINDTGVDAAHPDLRGRVTGPATTDVNGHGTFMAGVIASSGDNGPDGAQVPGSMEGASYRGMAPAAELFSLRIGLGFGALDSDSYLQEQAALSNAFIVNNSWTEVPSDFELGENFDYTLSSASWDAAVRDALPGVEGSQPLLVVMAAGNFGLGSDDGQGGQADTIVAPATAKNVITVGALEHYRNISNEVVIQGQTNLSFLGETDSSNQVAAFSSRGNVGVGIEGGSGRYKPDVAAPGTFVVSTRSDSWTPPDRSTRVIVDDSRTNRLVLQDQTNLFNIFLPRDAIQLRIRTVPLRPGDPPLPPLLIHAAAGAPPLPTDYVGTNDVTIPATSDLWFYSIGNTNEQEVAFNILTYVTVTNDVGNYFEVLGDLNGVLAPWYRYDRGTSISAAMVSGFLALVQEYFAREFSLTNSPALMKALLINGARTTSDDYTFQTDALQTHLGWGLPNLTNSLPLAVDSGAIRFYDQSLSNALVTGASQTRTITLQSNALDRPLRITLAWTDPPGNPSAGLKLVNNLDLIVTNVVTGDVYVGNSFGGGGVFTTLTSTNDPLPFDSVNNVENVFLEPPLSTEYTVTVLGRRVNVNAVTAMPEGVAQDYALVISAGDPPLGTPMTVRDGLTAFNPVPRVLSVTNGVPVLNVTAGDHDPLLLSTNGVTNQWTFFILTNQIQIITNIVGSGSGSATNLSTNGGQFVAFVTFLPPNLSRSRYREADIDLYVSTDPTLTNLNPVALDASLKSRGRGGTESVIITNSPTDVIYFAGVKSEDRQAAEFGFFAVATSTPFSQTDSNGNVILTAFPAGVEIPDGTPDQPQAALMFAFATEDITIENVVVTNVISHQFGGDLLGNLSHDSDFVVLNNHRFFQGTEQFIWDDSDSGDIPFSEPVDGPGTLRDFTGDQALGSWQFTMVDDSQFQTGRVDFLSIRLEPQEEETNGVTTTEALILPNRFFFTSVDVPFDATNLQVCVSQQEGPVEVYIRRADYPNRGEYDVFGLFAPPGGCLRLTPGDSPPLTAGRYFIGVFNPNGIAVKVKIEIRVERDLNAGEVLRFPSYGSVPILDDAVTNGTIFVDQAREVYDVNVGVRIRHERASDLVLHLVSPQGTRLLLAENRGRDSAEGYGAGDLETNYVGTVSSGTYLAATNTFGVAGNQGYVLVDYEFYSEPDQMTIYYDGDQIYDTGLISSNGLFLVPFGPGNATNVVLVMNEGNNAATNTVWEYTPTFLTGRFLYTVFTENTNATTLPMKFAQPPFTNNGLGFSLIVTGQTVMQDGFEQGIMRVVPVGQGVSGWTVSADNIEVLTSLPAPVLTSPHTGARFIELNGTSPGTIFTNVTTQAGQDYLLSFAYAANILYNDEPEADVRIDGSSVAYIVAPTNVIGGWYETSVVFRANGPQSLLELVSTVPGVSGVFFDTFEIKEIATQTFENYFLPEEPLIPIRGENALGQWRLEVWDNRVGGDVTGAVLLGWQLDLTFVRTNVPVTTLTNGLPYTGTVSGSNGCCFEVYVPLNAVHATNSLNGSGPLDLLFNQDQVPTFGNPLAGDYYLLTNTVDGRAILWTNGLFEVDSNGMQFNVSTNPVLVPGQRYYLCVRNSNPSQTNTFTLQVDFDQSGAVIPVVMPLTNAVAFTNTILPTTALDYYYFDVASNAYQISFELLDLSGDVNLYVRRGLPLPNEISYDYESSNGGTTNELIFLTDGTFTLLPGIWYLGVLNADVAPVTYTVLATQWTVDYVDLTNNLAYGSQVTLNGTDYYRYNVSPIALGVDFETLGANGDVDLYVREGGPPPLVGPGNYFYASTNPGLGDEFVTVTNSAPTNPLVPGDWWLAVVNRAAAPVDYAVRAFEHTIPPVDVVTLTNAVGFSNLVTVAEAQHYVFTVSPAAVQADFEVLLPSGSVDLLVGQGSRIYGLTNVLCVSTNSGTVNEWIRAALSGTPNCILTPGDWFLVVTNVGTNDVTYTVRATEYVPGSTNLVILANGISYSNQVAGLDFGMHAGWEYYRYTVGPNPVEAYFELFNLTGDADLYLRRGLPLPLPGDPGVVGSATAGTTPELIRLTTNGVPVALAPGDWYLTVLNMESFPVDYTVRVTEMGAGSIRRLVNADPFTNTVAAANGTPTDGTHYYVFNVPANNPVQAVFETYGADGDVDLYVGRGTPLPGPADYDAASANAGWADELIALYTNGLPVALTPGDWFLAVVNREVTPVTYTVRATALTGAGILTLTNGQPILQTLAPADTPGVGAVGYYSFIVTNQAVQADFHTFGANGDVDLYLTQNLPLPNPLQFDRDSANPGLAEEGITLFTGSAPLPLAPGTYYLAVWNRDLAAVTFSLCAHQFRPGIEIGTLTDGIPLTNSVTRTGCPRPGSTHYYQFTVTTNAQRAQFEILHPTGNVDLLLSRGLPLPTLLSRDFASARPATNDELIVVVPTSSPVPLTAGSWYAGVVNNAAGTVNYTALATEYAQSGTNFVFTGYTFSAGSLCFSWTNTLPGAHYYLMGTVSLTPPNWEPISTNLTAQGSELNYCLPLPSTYRFFQLVDGLVPAP